MKLRKPLAMIIAAVMISQLAAVASAQTVLPYAEGDIGESPINSITETFPNDPFESDIDEPTAKSICFRTDSDYFSSDDSIGFYIYDPESEMYGSNNGWTANSNWGSKKTLGTKVEGSDDLIVSYDFDIPAGHEVILIIYNRTNDNQTGEIVLSDKDYGKTLCLTGDVYVELYDDFSSSDFCCAFEGSDEPCMRKYISQDGHVRGDVLMSRDTPEMLVADKLNRAVRYDTAKEVFTYETLSDIMSELETDSDSVWSYYTSKYGVNSDAEMLLYGIDELIPGDCDRDGLLSASDALMVLRVSSGLTRLMHDCDVDMDGAVTSNDAMIILRASVGLD